MIHLGKVGMTPHPKGPGPGNAWGCGISSVLVMVQLNYYSAVQGRAGKRCALQGTKTQCSLVEYNKVQCDTG